KSGVLERFLLEASCGPIPASFAGASAAVVVLPSRAACAAVSVDAAGGAVGAAEDVSGCPHAVPAGVFGFWLAVLFGVGEQSPGICVAAAAGVGDRVGGGVGWGWEVGRRSSPGSSAGVVAGGVRAAAGWGSDNRAGIAGGIVDGDLARGGVLR